MSVYELRIYDIMPGKMDAIQGVMRELMVPLMPTYGMEAVGFWKASDEDTIYWIVRHDGLDAIVPNWDRFHGDAGGQRALAARTGGNPFVKRQRGLPLVGVPGLPPETMIPG